MIGKTISHYHILEELGCGGMGIVYKAEDVKLKRTVALKFLPTEFTRDEEAKTRFLLEAQAASALEHNNICNIHEIDETDEGQLFIVMACYEGQTLKQKIEQGPLPIDEAVDTAIQIADGLAKAHTQKIIHRDIKPANILLTQDGTVKIVDFGLAKLSGRTKVTVEGSTMGTIAYMSPEQAQGDEVDQRTDIWSLGVLIYEMLSGQLPFKGEYDQAVVYSILNEEPSPPTALRSGIPPELERIVLKTLSKKKEERYQHIDELGADLKTLQRKISSGEDRTVPSAAVRKPTGRISPRPLLLGSAILLILVTAAVIYFWLTNRPEPAIPEKAGRKIAVLPLLNLTGDPAQEYFCDGMTEQLITNISRVPELKVISRTSVMRYKNTQKDIRQISEELNVKYVLEGSVRKSGKRIRVTVQLIEAREGTHLWANDYDRQLEDIFTIQDDVAQSIARALEVAFSARSKKMMRSSYPANFAAFDSHMKTRYFIDNVYSKTRKEEDFRRAIEMAKETIKLDPNYYLGYYDLAYVYDVRRGLIGKVENDPLVEKYVRLAYRLNPQLPETNAGMAYVLFRAGKIDSVIAFTRAAIDMHANTWDPLQLIGNNMNNLGLHRQAIRFFNKAAELNPFSIHTLSSRGWNFLLTGQLDRAIEDFRRAYQIQPDFISNLIPFAMAMVFKKNYVLADSLLRRAEQQKTDYYRNYVIFVRAFYWASLGQKEEALALNRWPGVLATLGMKDEAIAVTDSITENKSSGYFLLSYLPLIHLPFYDNLRNEPRFKDIIAREKKRYEQWLKKFSPTEKEMN